jgi:hypothetical protein
MTKTTRKFNRFDAAAIRRATRAYMGQRVLVEYGNRFDPAGTLTADSTRWDDETSDLNDLCQLESLNGTDTAVGFTLDLYIYSGKLDDGGELLLNLDARWDGASWTIVDPFRPAHTQSATPTR